MFNKDTYCALIMLIELGDRYLINGCTYSDVAEKYLVPIGGLQHVVPCLERAGFIQIERGHEERMFLKIPPARILISDVIQLFCVGFPGQFVDTATGCDLQQSDTLNFLIREHEYVCRIIKKRFKNINLDKYCQRSKIRF